jgi:type I restriction enzyme S subunit
MSFNGWKKVKIEEIGFVVTGKTPSSKTPDHFGDIIPFVTPTDFKNYHKKIYSADRYLSKKGKEGLNGKVLPPNSVVVTCIGSDMGKVALNSVECVTNQQINSIIPYEGKVDANFLFYTISVALHKKFQALSSIKM